MIESLQNYHKIFLYYRSLGEKAMTQLKDEDKFFWTAGEESNSIAVIVQHLHGNMKSRWTDFLTSDGEKEWRNRDREFELYAESKEEIMKLWEEGWNCLFEALESVKPSDEEKLVYIRNQGHSIKEAVERQLAHYAYHVGQIVFLAKMIKGEDWKSLSIPKGDSQHYNSEKFAIPKHREHFTKEFLDGSFYKKS